jgi:dephospho-CoA kinase
MIKLGITGGIGSGKSYISDIVRNLGVPVYDCDSEAKCIINENQEVQTALNQLTGIDFSEEVWDKQKLAAYLFASEENARRVNAIVHPAVKQDFLQWAAASRAPMVGIESAILLESMLADVADKVLLVSASETVRLLRVMKRDGSTEEQVRARMARQASDSILRAHSDFEIVNNGTLRTELLTEQVRNILLACGVPEEFIVP